MTETIERRVRTERRVRDAGPPRGEYERRRCAERRLPDLVEATISEFEWAKLFGGMATATIANNDVDDQAAAVLGRVSIRY